MKTDINELGHMNKLAENAHVLVKTFKNHLLQNQLTDYLETLYVASVLQVLLRLCPWVDRDPIYAKAKFGNLG